MTPANTKIIKGGSWISKELYDEWYAEIPWSDAEDDDEEFDDPIAAFTNGKRKINIL